MLTDPEKITRFDISETERLIGKQIIVGITIIPSPSGRLYKFRQMNSPWLR